MASGPSVETVLATPTAAGGLPGRHRQVRVATPLPTSIRVIGMITRSRWRPAVIQLR